MDFHEFDNLWFALQVKVRFEEMCSRILRSKGSPCLRAVPSGLAAMVL